jgi:signal transduction histidine kinase/CheY-like chemotaxis protein
MVIVAVIHVSQLVARIIAEEKSDNPAKEKVSVITKALLFLYEGESLTQFLDDENEDFTLFNQTLDSVYFHLQQLESYAPDSSMQEKLSGMELLLLEKRENTRLLMETRREMNRVYSKYISDGINAKKGKARETEVTKEENTQSSAIVVQRQKKGFLKRLAEAFVPVKSDTALVTNSVTSLRTDSLVNEYNPSDTIASVLKKIQAGIDEEYELLNAELNRRVNDLRDNNSITTGRISQILFEIENEESTLAIEQEAAKGEMVRKMSTHLAVIAIASLVLILVFLYLILRDISRSRYYRKELEESRQFAEDLLHSRERFMLMISHDLRAPLSSILGYMELLKQSCRGESSDVYMYNISVLSRHMLSLVNDLLDFHRLESGKISVRPVPFNLCLLFDEICAGFKPLTDSKGLELKLDMSSVSPSSVYMGDPIRIRQVVGNLLSNAIKFTPEGAVYVTVSPQEGEGSDDKVLISVKDEGPGIMESEQEVIFKEFTRLEGSEKTEGFGLGLSIAFKLATLMNGSLSLESALGKGSTFILSLALPRTGMAVAGCSEGAKLPAVGLHNANCLTIDDDILQLKLTEELLRRNGIRVTAMSNPNEALSLLKTKRDFDIILTDIQMPLLNGYELLTAIRETDVSMKKTPVIALSAGISEDRQHYIDAGFSGFLNKPFTIEEFAALSDELFPPKAQAVAVAPLKISALTAYAADDKEAADLIVQVFKEETQKSLSLLQEALKDVDRQTAAGISHKLIPLFSTLEAEALVAQLRVLEANEAATDESRWKQILEDLICGISAAMREIDGEWGTK